MPPTGHKIFKAFLLSLSAALACPTLAGASSFMPTHGPLADAIKRCESGSFAAAESALAGAGLPAALQAPQAPLDRAQAQLELVRLIARGFAPGMGDTTWAWRGERLIRSLERLHADDATMAAALTARARVEYRLGMWHPAAASARAALAQLGRGNVRDDLGRYRAHLALIEATSTESLIEPRAHLALADSLARLLGAAAKVDRARHLRLSATVALLEGKLPEAARLFAEAVAAADAQSPVNEAERGLALVFQGYAEGFSDAVKGDRHRTEAARRIEATLGLSDERTLLVMGRSVAGLRDPARLPEADAMFVRAQDYLRANGLSARAAAWDVDYFQSRIQFGLQRYPRCRELLAHALEVSLRWNGEGTIREMVTHIDWGNVVWWERGADSVSVASAAAAATEHYRRAVALGLQLEPTFLNDPNVTRINFASVFSEAGRVREARDEFAAAWKSYTDRQGETFRLASQSASLAARASRALGDTAQASLWFRRALAPFGNGDSGEREEVAGLRESVALFEWSRGNSAAAFEQALGPAQLRLQVIEETAPWLPDGDALRFASNRRIIAGLLNTIAMRAPGAEPGLRSDAWSSTVHGRSLVLEAMLRRARVQADTSAAARAAGALRRELATLVIAALRAPDTRAQAGRRDSLRGAIRRQEQDDGSPLSVADVSPRAIMAGLGANGVLVSYTRFALFDPAESHLVIWKPRDTYGAFVLRPGDAAPRVVELGRADSIDAAVAAWRTALIAAGGSPGERAAGARVRELVWDPIHALLAGATQVYMVPDGELQKLNWYALPVGRDRFLVDEPLVLHRLSHERDLLMTPATPGAGMLALGGMDYDRTGAGSVPSGLVATKRLLPSCRSFLDERFESLPASLAEARTVSALGRRLASPQDTARVQLLTGAAADEGAFKRLAPGRRVVHLATHAFFLGAECAKGSAADVLSQNPLVFSGIALAGANQWRDAAASGGEDGLLTAEELAGMRLKGVEWLVLSGCESGLGQVNAWEGLYGLPRAARQAGVRTLVVSLLPVDDDASRVWMKSLYEAHFATGEPTALAVRTASRNALAWLRRTGRAADPRLWGAFVALGD